MRRQCTVRWLSVPCHPPCSPKKKKTKKTFSATPWGTPCWGHHPSHPHRATRVPSSLRRLSLVQPRLSSGCREVTSPQQVMDRNLRVLLRVSSRAGFTAGIQQCSAAGGWLYTSCCHLRASNNPCSVTPHHAVHDWCLWFLLPMKYWGGHYQGPNWNRTSTLVCRNQQTTTGRLCMVKTGPESKADVVQTDTSSLWPREHRP